MPDRDAKRLARKIDQIADGLPESAGGFVQWKTSALPTVAEITVGSRRQTRLHSRHPSNECEKRAPDQNEASRLNAIFKPTLEALRPMRLELVLVTN